VNSAQERWLVEYYPENIFQMLTKILYYDRTVERRNKCNKQLTPEYYVACLVTDVGQYRAIQKEVNTFTYL
jgi:hypothetical protein